MRVLVTGGAGFVGSVVVEELVATAAERIVVLDDLSTGHPEALFPGVELRVGRIDDREFVVELCRRDRIEAAIHLAARSRVGESVADPAGYYEGNLAGSLRLLDALHEAGVKRFVLSSTAAVYGLPRSTPITEDMPTLPVNPYGETKLALEQALKWYARGYGLRFVSLRYFNAAGATERCGEAHDPETHLIPLVLAAAAGEGQAVEVYGTDYDTPDGTCVRDYVHVADLADAHVLALQARGDAANRAYNLGSEAGYSVMQVLAAAEQVVGRAIPHVLRDRRPGDPPVLVARAAREGLGWQPRRSQLHRIIEDAWRWRQRNPRGYADSELTAAQRG
jgi:UDP-glucose 4-epimerase